MNDWKTMKIDEPLCLFIFCTDYILQLAKFVLRDFFF